MKKTPVWIRDPKTKSYDRIPYEAMIKRADGSYLLPHDGPAEAMRFLDKYLDYFEPEHFPIGWVFLGRRNRMARVELCFRYVMYLAVAAIGGAAMLNFVSGHWRVGIFSTVVTAIAVVLMRVRRLRFGPIL